MQLDKFADVAKIAHDLPKEEYDALVSQIASTIPAEAIYEARLPEWGPKVRELPVSAEGFCLYYQCKFLRPVPPVVKYLWAPAFERAWYSRRGVLLEGHRGQAKSTFLTTWVEYIIGKRPEGSTQFVRINDDQAIPADKNIAETIEFNPGWKACFPNIVPDRKKGWAPTGRYVMDLDIVGTNDDNYDQSVGYGVWVQKCSRDHNAEASFLVCSISSRDIIGKHPSNGQYFDDFHDETNTRSKREMQAIVDIIEKNLIPTWTRPEGHPLLGVACTLWDLKDGYHSLLATDMFEHIVTPIFVLADNQFIKVGDKMVHPEWIDDYPVEKDVSGRDIKALWYPYYGGKVIRVLQKRPYFDQFYACDLKAGQGKVLRREWLHDFPVEKLGQYWPIYFGIDFASNEDKLKNTDSDFFALAVLAGIPGGGAVLIDGFYERIGLFEAMNRVKLFAQRYPTLVTVGIEKFGSGKDFATSLLYNSGLSIVKWPLEGAPIKSKGQRYQDEVAPLFIDGRLWLLDLPRPFITRFIDDWVTWDGTKTRDGHDDTLDAVYVACGMAYGNLQPVPVNAGLPVNSQNQMSLSSPWSSLGT